MGLWSSSILLEFLAFSFLKARWAKRLLFASLIAKTFHEFLKLPHEALNFGG